MIRFRIAMRLPRWGPHSVAAQTPEYGYQVVHVYPHDPNAFTEGLEYRAGFLYESTGLKGRSWLRKEKLETGQVLQQIDLDPQYFGEGITILNQQIVQLTYQSEIGFVYDQSEFSGEADLQLLGRRLGADQRWPEYLHGRWHGADSYLGSSYAPGKAPHHGARSRPAGHECERARMGARRDLCQHLANKTLSRAFLPWMGGCWDGSILRASCRPPNARGRKMF